VHDVEGVIWTVPAYYTAPQLIGVGSFGSVGSSVDQRTGHEVALKKVTNPFFSNKVAELEKEQQAAVAAGQTVRAQQLLQQGQVIQRQAKRLYREVKLLSFMAHPNIIAMRDVYVAPSADGGEDVYIVMQKMGADLKRIVEAQVLSDAHCQMISYQISKALAYVHSAGIMHRDLKCENVAMNENMDLRVLDFGMARGVNQAGTGHTAYVVTRYYRAPEVLCFEFDAQSLHYTEGVDSWALGCIIAEMIIGRVLFEGANFMQQLSAIADKLGRPPPEFLAAIINEDVKEYTVSLPERPTETLTEFFAGLDAGPVNPLAIDLITKLLVYNPQARLKAHEALAHPYFADIRDVGSEVRATVRFDESFERNELSIQGWREQFILEMTAFKTSMGADGGGGGGGGGEAAP